MAGPADAPRAVVLFRRAKSRLLLSGAGSSHDPRGRSDFQPVLFWRRVADEWKHDGDRAVGRNPAAFPCACFPTETLACHAGRGPLCIRPTADPEFRSFWNHGANQESDNPVAHTSPLHLAASVTESYSIMVGATVVASGTLSAGKDTIIQLPVPANANVAPETFSIAFQ